MPDRTPPSTDHREHTREAWMRLRVAVAEEYVAKLPALLRMDEFARLAGMTIGEVRNATLTGELMVSLRDGRHGIAPADNLPFLVRERLLRLQAPAQRRSRPARRVLEVSPAAYERVWDEAVREGMSPQEALDRLLANPGDAGSTTTNLG